MFGNQDPYIMNYEFQVTFGVMKMGFNKISNMKSKIQYDTIVEGGSLNGPHFLLKTKTQPDVIIFEKGMTTQLKDVVFSTITEGMVVRGVLIFVKKNGSIKRVLTFEEGLILSKSLSNLDANHPGVFIESLEIAHSGLYDMPIPSLF